MLFVQTTPSWQRRKGNTSISVGRHTAWLSIKVQRLTKQLSDVPVFSFESIPLVDAKKKKKRDKLPKNPNTFLRGAGGEGAGRWPVFGKGSGE